MYALEAGNLAPAMQRLEQRPLPPRELRITIRYSDWWFWEHSAPLRISDEWHQRFRAPAAVERVVLELETRWGKRDELLVIVRRQVLAWRFLSADKDAEFVFARSSESSWLGSTRPGGQYYQHHWPSANGVLVEGSNQMKYCIVRLEWEKKQKSELTQ